MPIQVKVDHNEVHDDHIDMDDNDVHNQDQTVGIKIDQDETQKETKTKEAKSLAMKYIEEKFLQIKKRTMCKFCHENVTNFERHLIRRHENENEVIDLQRYSTKTKTEKKIQRDMIGLLR